MVGQHPAKKQVKTNEREGKHPRPSILDTLGVLCDMVGRSVDPQEMLSIPEEVVGARNGWKRILKACSCQRRRKAHSVKAETPV